MELKYLESYNEAKSICIKYKEYKGDKRSLYYKNLQRSVVDIFMGRMTNFGNKLGLPTYVQYFYDN